MNEVLGKTGAGFGRRLADLNAGWRNSLISALGIESEDFQLIQGTFGLPFDQPITLFAMADKIPSASAVHYCDAVMRFRWSDSYLRLLTALLPETENGLRGYLGDRYSHWIAWRNAGLLRDSQLRLFRAWSTHHLSAARAETALRMFEDTMTTATNLAFEKYFDSQNVVISVTPRGVIGRFPKYSGTVGAAHNALQWGRSAEVRFDSDNMDISVAGKMFHEAGTRFERMFSGVSASAFEPLEHQSALGRITISGRIGAHGWLRTSPGAWCDEQLIGRAIADECGSTHWDSASSAGGWNTFFSPRGCLARRRSHLLAVSDYRLKLTCHGSYSEPEVARMRKLCEAGIWPFFSTAGPSARKHDLVHHGDGSISVTVSHPAKSFQIWGAKVQSLLH